MAALDILKDVCIVLCKAAVMAVCVVLFFGIVYFPMTVGDSSVESAEFYEDAYSEVVAEANEAEPVEPEIDDSEYVDTAREMTEQLGLDRSIEEFVRDYRLEDGRMLEVGAGSGFLQDVVDDYTGLDIAASAARFFHKPFVQGSATDMPLPDNEFDSVITIFVLEHVPDPEKMLEEMRRVLKPGGYLFLAPAWNVRPWAAEGYPVRPYSDFGLGGKLYKLSLNLFMREDYRYFQGMPTRLLRDIYWQMTEEPTRLRYTKRDANYDKYWVPDSDAPVSVDSHEALLWFLSRGDECVNCSDELMERIALGPEIRPLIIRVNKPVSQQVAGAESATTIQ